MLVRIKFFSCSFDFSKGKGEEQEGEEGEELEEKEQEGEEQEEGVELEEKEQEEGAELEEEEEPQESGVCKDGSNDIETTALVVGPETHSAVSQDSHATLKGAAVVEDNSVSELVDDGKDFEKDDKIPGFHSEDDSETLQLQLERSGDSVGKLAVNKEGLPSEGTTEPREGGEHQEDPAEHGSGDGAELQQSQRERQEFEYVGRS